MSNTDTKRYVKNVRPWKHRLCCLLYFAEFSAKEALNKKRIQSSCWPSHNSDICMHYWPVFLFFPVKTIVLQSSSQNETPPGFPLKEKKQPSFNWLFQLVILLVSHNTVFSLTPLQMSNEKQSKLHSNIDIYTLWWPSKSSLGTWMQAKHRENGKNNIWTW